MPFAIDDKRERVKLMEDLGEANSTILQSLKEQLIRDSLLMESGYLAENIFDDNFRTYKEKESTQIENKLRQRALESEIIEDRQTMILSRQTYTSRIQEFRLSLYEQLGNIRKTYLDYQKKYLIRAPLNGYANIRDRRSDLDMVTTGDLLLYLTPSEEEQATTAEIYVGSQNAGKVIPGMRVRVGLAEFDQKEYGIYYTRVLRVSETPQDNQYKAILECSLPLETSYDIQLPMRDNYRGQGEILLGQINLLTKIKREIHFNRAKYASL